MHNSQCTGQGHLVVVVIQQVVLLGLEVADDVHEGADETFHALQLVGCKALELVDGAGRGMGKDKDKIRGSDEVTV